MSGPWGSGLLSNIVGDPWREASTLLYHVSCEYNSCSSTCVSAAAQAEQHGSCLWCLLNIITCQPAEPQIWWRVRSRWWRLCRCRRTRSWTSCLCVRSLLRGGSPSPEDTHTQKEMWLFCNINLQRWGVQEEVSAELFYLDHLLCDLSGLVNVQHDLGVPHHRIKCPAFTQTERQGGKEKKKNTKDQKSDNFLNLKTFQNNHTKAYWKFHNMVLSLFSSIVHLRSGFLIFPTVAKVTGGYGEKM